MARRAATVLVAALLALAVSATPALAVDRPTSVPSGRTTYTDYSYSSDRATEAGGVNCYDYHKITWEVRWRSTTTTSGRLQSIRFKNNTPVTLQLSGVSYDNQGGTRYVASGSWSPYMASYGTTGPRLSETVVLKVNIHERGKASMWCNSNHRLVVTFK